MRPKKEQTLKEGFQQHSGEMATPSSSHYKHTTACFPASLVLKQARGIKVQNHQNTCKLADAPPFVG